MSIEAGQGEGGGLSGWRGWHLRYPSAWYHALRFPKIIQHLHSLICKVSIAHMDANVSESEPTTIGGSVPAYSDGMGKVQRLEVVCADAATMDVLASRIADGESLSAVCRVWGVPHGGMMLWLMKDEKRMRIYMNALNAAAFREIEEAKDIADASGDAKLQVDTRWKRAKHHAPLIYGDKDAGAGGGGITVIVQRGGGHSSDAQGNGTEPPIVVSADGRNLTISQGD